MTGRRYSIMLSSAGKDLAEHRKQVREAILAAGMFPVAMENDADVALPQDLIDASLAKVDEADGYIGLIGYRYGQVSPCPERNPGNLSLTELEFRRARQRNIPICMLIMHDDHPVPRSAVRDEPDAEGKLTAFIKLAKEGRIYAEFKSLDDVKVKATATLARLRKWLAENAKTKSKKGSGFVGDGAADPEPGIPAPPAFYAKPTFIGKSHFFGRLRELGWLDEWAATPGEPVLIFEAIGGMGKSMLTWEWVQEEARKQPGEWPGIFWYSFYERGATMHDFCVTTLAYMTGQPLADFRARPTSALGDELLRQLTARRWLLALDGIERILVAYHRLDAAQADDGDVAHDPDSANRPYEDCIRPTDSDLLQKLCGAAPSKLVMSSRLMPTALRGIGARPRDGVRHRLLIGLAPEDAERLMRDIGVRGDSARMRHFLDKEFGCHPLVVAVIAGVVYDFAPSPCDFDGWLDHPDGGANVNLASPDIKQRRNHILKSAFDALDADAREVVARLAMCAHALDWQTLQALNPRRPAPPEEVPEPKRGDDQWDFEIFQLEQQLSSAESRKEKAALEAQLQARREKTEAEYQEARRRHAAYQAALTAWQRSPKYRAANEWLRRLPPELERRGLLQWDRDANLFDLHPVIRHFAVDSTSAAARAETGQVLADFFASRPAPAYETAAALADLDTGLQIVRAFSLAGKIEAAVGAWRGGLRLALPRLELHHETLAVLRPMFPDGWSRPPIAFDDADFVANEASAALSGLGRRDEARAQQAFSIRDDMKREVSSNLATKLRNYASDVSSASHAEHLYRLSQDIAAASNSPSEVAWATLGLIANLIWRGETAAARMAWAEIEGRQDATFDAQLKANISFVEAELRLCERRLDEAWLGAAIARAAEWRQPWCVRKLWRLCGEFRAAAGRHRDAAAAFETAIEMARRVRLHDTDAEAGYAIALHHLGRAEEALAAAQRAERGPGIPAAALAEFYQLTGDRDKAVAHARSGYTWYWNDGPPYSWHWELERCRKVLRELGEAEPQLPPYDPSNIIEEDFEPEIRRLLAEHAAGKPAEGKDDEGC